MNFEDALAQVPKHYAQGGDILGSHFWTMLSTTFPEGEDFFVRSVRHYRDQLTDPVLKRQVNGFIGQEAMHGREHRAFNDHLNGLGYPVASTEAFMKKINAVRERLGSPQVNLASTVVAEHFTALLAEKLLSDPEFRAELGHPAVVDIYTWHALEESEHKAVAFDVYRAVGGSERVRIWTMKIMRLNLLLMPVMLFLQVVLTDKAARRPGALRKSYRKFRQSRLFTKEMWEAIKDFERPDFHPDDRDTDALLDEWKERLFGVNGELNGQMAGQSAAA